MTDGRDGTEGLFRVQLSCEWANECFSEGSNPLKRSGYYTYHMPQC
jgi:hypothetical protein